MGRMKHSAKVKLARKNRSISDIVNHVPIFETSWWEARKAKKALKVSVKRSKKVI